MLKYITFLKLFQREKQVLKKIKKQNKQGDSKVQLLEQIYWLKNKHVVLLTSTAIKVFEYV